MEWKKIIFFLTEEWIVIVNYQFAFIVFNRQMIVEMY